VIIDCLNSLRQHRYRSMMLFWCSRCNFDD